MCLLRILCIKYDFLCTVLSLSLSCTLSGYFDDSNSIPSDTNPLHTLFDSAPDSLPPDPPITTSTASVMQPSTSSSDQHCNSAAMSLLPPVVHHVSNSAAGPLSHHSRSLTHLNIISPMPFHLPTVICHPDIEPSSADNMLSQQQQQPPLGMMDNSDCHMSFSSVSAAPPPSLDLPPPTIDFLDYLDAGSLDSASADVQYNVAIATGPGDELEDCEGGNPINHQRWVTVSPERPRMFPRKLY